MSEKQEAEAMVWEIRRRTRREYSAEEKARVVLEALRGRGEHRRAVREERGSVQSFLVPPSTSSVCSPSSGGRR